MLVSTCCVDSTIGLAKSVGNERFSTAIRADHPKTESKSATWIKLAREAFDHSIAADERFYERIAEQVPDDAPTLREPRMAIAHWDRGKLLEAWGDSEEALGEDFEAALILMPDLPKIAIPIEDRELDDWSSLLDVLSWDDPVIGDRLKHESARLAVMQLSSELAATQNIATVESVQSMIDDVLAYSKHYTDPGLQLLMTGSAAIGGETLLAARDAIRYTEWITVVDDPVDPGGRVSSATAGRDPDDLDWLCGSCVDFPGRAADQLVDRGNDPRSRFACLYHQPNLCGCDSVWCGDGLLPVPDRATSRGSSQITLAGRLP